MCWNINPFKDTKDRCCCPGILDNLFWVDSMLETVINPYFIKFSLCYILTTLNFYADVG